MAKAYAILCLRQNEINDLQKSTKQNPHEFAPHGGFLFRFGKVAYTLG